MRELQARGVQRLLRRFLVNIVLEEAAGPITILQHWKPGGN